jgi:hypothetical protein
MAYTAPIRVDYSGRLQPADAKDQRTYLRTGIRRMILHWRGKCEERAHVLRVDPRDVGDAFTALERAVDRSCAE